MKKVLLVLSLAMFSLSACQKDDDAPEPIPIAPVVVTTAPTVRTTSVQENFNNPPNTDVNVGFGGSIGYIIAGVSCGPTQNSNVQLEVGKTYSISVLVNNVSTFVGDIVIGANDVVTKSNVTTGASVNITYQSNCNGQGVATLVIAP